MKVLLFEQWHGGHYANYMHCLVPAIAARCDTLVIAATEKMLASEALKQRCGAIPNLQWVQVADQVSPALKAGDRIQAASNLLQCMRQVKPDFTVVSSADAQSSGLAAMNMLGIDAVKRYGPIEGTLHYGYGRAARSKKDRLKEFVYGQTYKHLPFSSVNFVNFAYYEYAVEKRLIAPERMRLVGDPVAQPPRIGRAAARRLLGLDESGQYLGLLGSLDSRKAIPQLLAAFRRADLGVGKRLVLAGRLDTGYAALIDDQYADFVRDGRLVVLNRFLSADELESGYEALDLATIAYNHLPVLASLALKAVAAGTPLLADDFGWLGAVTRRFQLGRCVDINDVDAFAQAMRDSLEAGPQPFDAAVDRLLAFHTEENFSHQMMRGLIRASQQAMPTTLDWEWVMEALPPERRHLF